MSLGRYRNTCHGRTRGDYLLDIARSRAIEGISQRPSWTARGRPMSQASANDENHARQQ